MPTHFETNSRPKRRRMPHAFGAAALVSLALLAMLIFVQVAHTHEVDSDADHCQVCIAMHSAAPVAIVADLVVFVAVGRRDPVAVERVAVRHWSPKLFTRPPPSGC